MFKKTNLILALSLITLSFIFVTRAASAESVESQPIVINEIAWAGSSLNQTKTPTYYDEWIELYNPNEAEYSLNEVSLYGAGGGTAGIPLKGAIPAKGYYLITKLETPSPKSILDVKADLIASNLSISNSGFKLQLKAKENILDEINSQEKPFAGVNTDNLKASMARKNLSVGSSPENWFTSQIRTNLIRTNDSCEIDFGTPKAPNTQDKISSNFSFKDLCSLPPSTTLASENTLIFSPHSSPRELAFSVKLSPELPNKVLNFELKTTNPIGLLVKTETYSQELLLTTATINLPIVITDPEAYFTFLIPTSDTETILKPINFIEQSIPKVPIQEHLSTLTSNEIEINCTDSPQDLPVPLQIYFINTQLNDAETYIQFVPNPNYQLKISNYLNTQIANSFLLPPNGTNQLFFKCLKEGTFVVNTNTLKIHKNEEITSLLAGNFDVLSFPNPNKKTYYLSHEFYWPKNFSLKISNLAFEGTTFIQIQEPNGEELEYISISSAQTTYVAPKNTHFEIKFIIQTEDRSSLSFDFSFVPTTTKFVLPSTGDPTHKGYVYYLEAVPAGTYKFENEFSGEEIEIYDNFGRKIWQLSKSKEKIISIKKFSTLYIVSKKNLPTETVLLKLSG